MGVEEGRQCGGVGLTLFRISFDDNKVDWRPAQSREEALRLFLDDNPAADVHHVRPEALAGQELLNEMERHGRIPTEGPLKECPGGNSHGS